MPPKKSSTPTTAPRRRNTRRLAPLTDADLKIIAPAVAPTKQPPPKKSKLAADTAHANDPRADSYEPKDNETTVTAIDVYPSPDSGKEAGNPEAKSDGDGERADVNAEKAGDGHSSPDPIATADSLPKAQESSSNKRKAKTEEAASMVKIEDASANLVSTPDVAATTKKPAAKKRKTTAKSNDVSPNTEDGENKAIKKPASRKRKTTAKSAAVSPDTNDGDDAAIKQPASRKRKTTAKSETVSTETKDDEDTEVKQPATKKRKTAAAKANSESPNPTRKSARQPKPSKKELESRGSMEPPPLGPAEVTKPVADKVRQVKQFVASHVEKQTQLQRDPENTNLISIPESALLTAVMNMRLQYEMGPVHEAAISDVDECITKHFKQDIGETKGIDWVTINARITTEFEEAIHEKCARHGLGNVNLLEIELEMSKRELLKQKGLGDPGEEIASTAEQFLSTFEAIWRRVEAKVAEEEQTSGEKIAAQQDEGGEKALADEGNTAADETNTINETTIGGDKKEINEKAMPENIDGEKPAVVETVKGGADTATEKVVDYETIAADEKVMVEDVDKAKTTTNETTITGDDKEMNRNGACPAPIQEL